MLKTALAAGERWRHLFESHAQVDRNGLPWTCLQTSAQRSHCDGDLSVSPNASCTMLAIRCSGPCRHTIFTSLCSKDSWLVHANTFLCLQVKVHNVLFEDQGATLLHTVQILPVLRHLAIRHCNEASSLLAPVSASNGLPTCKELAELRSCSLTRLTVEMLGCPADGNLLRLSGLPELRSCWFIGSESDTPLNMCIDGTSFEDAMQLQQLHVESDTGLQLQHGSLQQLGALTSLMLRRCGLRSVPANVGFLGGTLRQLDLAHSYSMQFNSSALENVLQCKRLEVVYLYKPDISQWAGSFGPSWPSVEQHMAQEGYGPHQRSTDSVKQMMKLEVEFLVRHGRRLHVDLDTDGLG